ETPPSVKDKGGLNPPPSSLPCLSPKHKDGITETQTLGLGAWLSGADPFTLSLNWLCQGVNPPCPWLRSQRCSPAGAGSVTDRIRPCPRAELCPSRSDSLSAANVTLDPDTAHPRLILSADRRSVRWGDKRQKLPNNPERFDSWPCVLGCEGFTSGRHYWELEVEAEVWLGGFCDVGVARASVSRKGQISFNPEQGIWAVGCSEDQYRAHTSPGQRITLSPGRAPRRIQGPRRIRVYLDYERGQVAFFDAGTRDPIFTFPPASFAGERIPPTPLISRTWRTQPAQPDRAAGG
uniref:B30.2/SPRY domain-containing protein n=1 Tax=Chrysemys picta bellii TaxID=8478 RepID=A0A8C3FBU8_CHRPI